MYQSILAATDGTALGDVAVRQAATLAKALGAKMTIVNVTGQPPAVSAPEVGWETLAEVYDSLEKADEDRARQVLNNAVAAAARLGCEATSIHIPNEVPYAGILMAATEAKADLIVMSTHGHRGINRLILGSQAAQVLTLSPVSVLIAK